MKNNAKSNNKKNSDKQNFRKYDNKNSSNFSTKSSSQNNKRGSFVSNEYFEKSPKDKKSFEYKEKADNSTRYKSSKDCRKKIDKSSQYKSSSEYREKGNKSFKNKSYNEKRKYEASGNRFQNDQKIYQDKNCDDLIWGKHSVYSALENGRSINRIWCTSEIRSTEKFFQILKETKNKGVLIEEVPWSRISQITYGAVHQGIALQIAYTKTVSLNDLINESKTQSKLSLILCLDGITDPHNVGAIIRSAEAFGCAGIVIPQRRSAGITGTVAKVAAGALEHISVCRVVNLNRTLQELKNEGFAIVGLKENGNINISNFKENIPLVVVVGSENKGLSVLTQKNCDYLVKIPLRGKTSSLNASVAAAITLHHLTRSLYLKNK